MSDFYESRRSKHQDPPDQLPLTSKINAATKPRIGVVLGAAVWPEGRPSPTLARRTAHALSLFAAGEIDMILGCGGVGKFPPSEADVILRLCLDAGVPKHLLLREGASTTTRENLTNALSVLRPLQPGKVLIVTDPYHAPRARLIASQLGLLAESRCPTAGSIGLRQWVRNGPREAIALVATLLRCVETRNWGKKCPK